MLLDFVKFEFYWHLQEITKKILKPLVKISIKVKGHHVIILQFSIYIYLYKCTTTMKLMLWAFDLTYLTPLYMLLSFVPKQKHFL